MAYYKMDSWGLEREDWRFGQICATLANTKRTKNQRPYKAKDFMPQKSNIQTPQQQAQILEAFFNG